MRSVEKSTKIKVAALAALALVLAVSVGAAGAIGASRALSADDEGERSKERIESGVPHFFGHFGLGRHGLRGLGFRAHGASLEAASSYLDVAEPELRERLREGETLAEIAEDEGKSVDGLVSALVDAASERIDDAVEDGRLTDEQAAELESELEERVTALVNGDYPRRGTFGRGFGFGFGHPGRGPWA
jgi:hypothetical protein